MVTVDTEGSAYDKSFPPSSRIMEHIGLNAIKIYLSLFTMETVDGVLTVRLVRCSSVSSG